MFMLSCIGVTATPLMVFIGMIRGKIKHPNVSTTYSAMFSETNMYALMLFGLLVYTVIAAYIFSREYSENTLKTVLTVPVSKTSFIIAKFLMLIIWILVLTVETWALTLLFAVIGGADKFSFAIIFKYLREFLIGGFLLYLTISPFVALTVWCKNIVTPIIAATTVAMINIAIWNESFSALFPWSAVEIVATGKLGRYQYSLGTVLCLVIFIAIFGFVTTIIYFRREDIK